MSSIPASGWWWSDDAMREDRRSTCSLLGGSGAAVGFGRLVGGEGLVLWGVALSSSAPSPGGAGGYVGVVEVGWVEYSLSGRNREGGAFSLVRRVL